MATVTQQRKLKELVDRSLNEGGLPLARTRWEQSLGLHEGDNGLQRFEQDHREVDHARWEVGEVFYSLLGRDWKTSLQELSATLGLGVPTYQVTESGPDHDKRFEAYAVVGEERHGPGHGLNKKQAEQEAAAFAFGALKTVADTRQAAVVGGVGA